MTFNDTDDVNVKVEDLGFYVYYYGVMGILMCVNIPGNILVMTTILRHRELRLCRNYLLVNQAVADILYGVLYPVYNLAQFTIVPSITEGFADYWVCTIFIAHVITVVFASPINLMIVTIDRYIAIVHPFHYEKYVTSKSTAIAIASVWIFSEVYSISVHVINPPNRGFALCRYEEMFTLVQTLMMNLMSGLVPLVVLTVLYIKIVQIVRYQSRRIGNQQTVVERTSSDRQKNKNNRNTSDNKSTAMIGLLLLFYLFAWCPILIYFLCVLLSKDRLSPYIGATCRMFVFTNSCVNVFVYSLRLQNFRKYMLKDLRSLRQSVCSCLRVKNRSVRTGRRGELTNSSDQVVSILVSEADNTGHVTEVDTSFNDTYTTNCY